MVLGALLTRWALRPAPRAPAAERPMPAAAQPAAQKPAQEQAFELPGDEQTGDASVSWGAKPGQGAAAAQAGAPASNPAEEKKYRGLGLVYGALTKAAGGLMKDPKAMAALFNNELVVKAFMSRDTVKAATSNSASLAAYLSDPANLSRFMAKGPVREGLNNGQLVNAVATSKLVGAMLDTPGGKALLNDPAAIAGVLKANPALLDALSNPAVLTAIAQNPRTTGLLGQISGGAAK
jgi:hypothetical protein